MVTVATRALGPFRNEPVRDFKDPADRASIESALARTRARLGARYQPVIDGRKIETPATFPSVNPAHPDEVVGEIGAATAEQAGEAVEVAYRRFPSWKATPVRERAEILFRAAELVRERRDDFNALMIFEVAKTWAEADADTAEAIDFMEFYGREALRYDRPPPLVPVQGEENELRYLPLGAGVVIPPWNFPFAITAGMTTAALVTGNTVVLKPSSDAAAIAAAFVDLLHEVGVPPGVLNFVPGSGAAIGDTLVAHPKTRFIAFTGSKDVGVHINELAAKVQPGQRWIKRVIAEMGGKDAIVVAADADLDQAVEGVVVSAYGYGGQKCSACSRAIVEAPVYDAFLERLKRRVETLVTGDPAKPETAVGPVINEKARRSILRYIEIGRTEGRLITGGWAPAQDGGYYVAPTVIADVAPHATIAQEEIFGPVLAVIKARDFEDAIRIANDTEFGLTGSVYSSDPRKLERAASEVFVGNLYLNRKSTGALVGGHPFGGFNMSGTDSKAGGYDYLLLFLQAKVISKRVGP
jgi:1-pyrroline-5-carboxylate dehydrogenase